MFQPLLKISGPRAEVGLVVGATMAGPDLYGRQRSIVCGLDQVLHGVVLVAGEQNPLVSCQVPFGDLRQSGLYRCNDPRLASAGRTLNEDQILRVDGEIDSSNLCWRRGAA